MKIFVTILLAAGLLYLVRRRLLHIDLSFFLLLAILLLSVASLSQSFILLAASVLEIVYEPLAIVLLALFVLLCLVTLLSVYMSSAEQRDLALVRRVAALELAAQDRDELRSLSQ